MDCVPEPVELAAFTPGPAALDLDSSLDEAVVDAGSGRLAVGDDATGKPSSGDDANAGDVDSNGADVDGVMEGAASSALDVLTIGNGVEDC